MAYRASGRADREGGADPFPWVVSLGCLLVGVALFLHSTMPALAERQQLEEAERSFGAELGAVGSRIEALRRQRSDIGRDPEALLFEFDSRHLSPQQAIDAVARDLDEAAEAAPAERPR
jgi:hypothetical protein